MIRFKKIIILFFVFSKILNNLTDINHPMFTKEKAGFFVWTIIHLYSAYYPENPT